MTSNLSRIVTQAKQDAAFEARFRQAANYGELSRLAAKEGMRVPAEELRLAFRARNSQVVARTLAQAGILPPQPAGQVPEWNEAKWDAVSSLDLSAVTSAMVAEKGWTEEHAVSVERRYRRLLYLAIAVPGMRVALTAEVEEYWLEHFRDRRRYVADCSRIHGALIFPLTGADAKSIFATWFAYEATFDEGLEESIGDVLLDRWEVPAVAWSMWRSRRVSQRSAA